MISYIERTYFNDLLNRGGYVLDFSTYRFDEFTLHSVGTALCEKYNLSKGKSLNEFINEEESEKMLLREGFYFIDKYKSIFLKNYMV